VTEQLWNRPVPIYIEVNPVLAIGGVYLYFRTESDVQYQMVQMRATGPGYYAELPCTMVQPRKQFYYIVVTDPNGTMLAYEGSPDQPFEIKMVDRLAGAAPTRPNGQPPEDCGVEGIGRPEAQPWESTLGAVCERLCALDEDCPPGRLCVNGCCGSLLEEEEEEEEEGEPVDVPGDLGLWAYLGVGAGFGFATGTVKEPKWYEAEDGSDWYGPDDYAHLGSQRDIDRQTTEIPSGLALSGFVARLGIGYHILPPLTVELNYRFAAPFDTSRFP
jgi:hypothetical protein